MTPHDTHRGGGILAAGAPAKPATAPPPGSGRSLLGGAQSDGSPSSERPQLDAVGRHYVCEVEGGRDLALVDALQDWVGLHQVQLRGWTGMAPMNVSVIEVAEMLAESQILNGYEEEVTP